MLSKDGVGHMNDSAILSNGRTVKGNGGRTVVVRATKDRFEGALEI
jgi:hypothetical protein